MIARETNQKFDIFKKENTRLQRVAYLHLFVTPRCPSPSIPVPAASALTLGWWACIRARSVCGGDKVALTNLQSGIWGGASLRLCEKCTNHNSDMCPLKYKDIETIKS